MPDGIGGVSDFMDAHVSQVLVAPGDPAALQRALAPLLARRTELAAIERQLGALDAQLQAIVSDQQRLRENMKALRGSAEEKQLLQRYTRQFDDQENKLDALRLAIAETRKQRDTVQGQLNALIAAFSYEG